MASSNSKGTWLIWILVVIAVAFTIMAFSKGKTPGQGVMTKGSAIDQNKVVADVAKSAGTEATGIKPDHTTADMEKIATQKVTSAIIVPPQAVEPKDTYAIQVYSFKEKIRAEVALRALKDKDYPAYIMVSDLGPRGIWYRVRVGTFTDEEEAIKTLDAITKDFKSGIIVTE